MARGWTTTKLIVAGSLGVLLLLLSLPGASITTFTGIPGLSGAVNSIIGSIITVFAVFLINRFGTATVVNLTFSILAIPLPLLGTPGFLPKIFIGFGIGLTSDIIYFLFKKHERLTAITIGIVSQYLTGLGIVFLGTLFGLPGAEKLQKLIVSPFVLVYVILLGLFGYLGLIIYKRLENTSLVKRIQGGQ